MSCPRPPTPGPQPSLLAGTHATTQSSTAPRSKPSSTARTTSDAADAAA